MSVDSTGVHLGMEAAFLVLLATKNKEKPRRKKKMPTGLAWAPKRIVDCSFDRSLLSF